MRRIFEIISGLREKPDKLKQKVALFASGFFTLIVFAGWLAYFNISAGSDSSVLGRIAGPFDTLKGDLSSLMTAMRGNLSSGKAAVFEVFNPDLTGLTEKEMLPAATGGTSSTATSSKMNSSDLQAESGGTPPDSAIPLDAPADFFYLPSEE